MKARIIALLTGLVVWIMELRSSQNAWESDPVLVAAVEEAEALLAEKPPA